AIYQCLLACHSFNKCMRELQILLPREAMSAHPQSGAYDTNKVEIEDYFALESRRYFFCAESGIDSACCDILVGLGSPRRHLELAARRPFSYRTHERWQQDRASIVGQCQPKSFLASSRIKFFSSDHRLETREDRLQFPQQTVCPHGALVGAPAPD